MQHKGVQFTSNAFEKTYVSKPIALRTFAFVLYQKAQGKLCAIADIWQMLCTAFGNHKQLLCTNNKDMQAYASTNEFMHCN